MKKVQIKKPDIKGTINRLKSLKKEDIKSHFAERKERRERMLERRRNSKFGKRMAVVYKTMNHISLIMHMLLACILNFAIEVISRHSLERAWVYMTGRPLVFLYNAFMIFVTFSIVYLVRRRIFTRILLSILWLILGIINGYLLGRRVTPFNAQDFPMVRDALSMANLYSSPVEQILLSIGVIALIIWLISMWISGGQYQGKMRRIIALGFVGLWFGLFTVVTNRAIEERVLSTYFGNMAFAYQDYGFPYCFMASIFNTGISQPHGYSRETIATIRDDANLMEVSMDEDMKAIKPNIIVIQLESFFDVSEVEFLETSEDPLPNFRRLSEEFSSGYIQVPVIGAGTANTELEVLTGMNLRFFGPGEIPYKTVFRHQTEESAATALKAFGYGAHAIHNHSGNFYSRALVFDNMGFDSFTSREFMNVLRMTPNGWATDDILIPHILNAMDYNPDQRDFIFAISVQPHGEFPQERVIENPRILVGELDDLGRTYAWEYFVNQIYEVDQFVGDLIEAIEARGEPSVVVFYGDHLPTKGLRAADLRSRYLHNTNYVIWDNIGLPKEDRNIAAYQLMADVFGRLGIRSGTIFNYHQSRRQTTHYLADLELLQYDILYGQMYVYDGVHPVGPGTMRMGIKDVIISDVVLQFDGTYSLLGSNMTRWSRVYVNGERHRATFLNNTRLQLPSSELQDGDIITVSQVGSRNTIFRTSPEFIFVDPAAQQEEEMEDQIQEEAED